MEVDDFGSPGSQASSLTCSPDLTPGTTTRTLALDKPSGSSSTPTVSNSILSFDELKRQQMENDKKEKFVGGAKPTPSSPVMERTSPSSPSRVVKERERRPSVVTDDPSMAVRRRSSLGIAQAPVQSFLNTSSNYCTVGQYVQDPVACGFLRAFCMKEHNEENLFFWLDVDHYKDLYFQGIAPKSEILDTARSILTTYIGPSATMEICVPCKLEKKMKQAEERLKGDNGGDLLTEDMFEECQFFALKTMTLDVYPRFVRSDQIKEFKEWVDGICPAILPTAPEGCMVEGLVEEKKDTPTEFLLDDVLKDKLLFPILVKCLKKKCCADNLLCLMQVNQFEKTLEDGDAQIAKGLAWSIFCNFLNEGSPYQVEYTNRIICKTVARNLPTPQASMFEDVKLHAHEALEDDYGRFRKSTDYKNLYLAMEKERASLLAARRSKGFKATLNFAKGVGAFKANNKKKVSDTKQA